MATVLTPDQLQTIRGRRPVKGEAQYSRERMDEIDLVIRKMPGAVRVVDVSGGAKGIYQRVADTLTAKVAVKDEPQSPLVPTKVSDEEYEDMLAERMAQYELIRHGE